MAHPRARLIAWLCFALALTFRLAILYGTGADKTHDRFEMVTVAKTFARTGQIANAYMILPTGPTAHVAPAYPVLLGYVYRVFGDGDLGDNAKQILACSISAARAALVVV